MGRRRVGLAAQTFVLAVVAPVRAAVAQPPSGPPPSGPPEAGPPPSGPPGARLVVREDGVHRVIVCRGRPVVVQGSGNTLTLRGACPVVTVAGSDNTLALDSARAIATSGHRNRVTYLAGIAGAVPRVDDQGRRNAVGPRL